MRKRAVQLELSIGDGILVTGSTDRPGITIETPNGIVLIDRDLIVDLIDAIRTLEDDLIAEEDR